MRNFHWSKEDYFPYLIDSFKIAVLALEYLVDDLHVNKELTIKKFLDHCGSEDFLWGIVKLMSSDSLRVSGNSAYVFGTIAETSDGIDRVVALLHNHAHPDSSKILPYLINLLKSADYECMMNAAGTIGTISENNVGRNWLISQPLLDDIIELSTCLLDSENIWVSSNAALVIARISIEDIGCEKLLSHKSSQKILQKLVDSLGCDNAGKGMNCAFAIGRICDNENGRIAVCKAVDSNKLVNYLSTMIEQNVDNGCTKNACYAMSCFAANQDAHRIIIESASFLNLCHILCKLLLTIKDPETQWFAAMLMKIFCSFPNGCIRMKRISIVWQTLNDLMKDENLYVDVREEIAIILDTLKPLEKPSPLRVAMKSTTQVLCEWDQINLKNKFSINYLLYKDDECVYKGADTSFLVDNLEPFTEYSFSYQILTVENNEKSVMSESLRVQTLESAPTMPMNLKLLAATITQLKIAWDAPEKLNGILKSYCVYNGEELVDHTNDHVYILSGLQPSTTYEISVCACNSAAKGEKATISCVTGDLGDVTPEKPVFGMIGTREILVRWQPSQTNTSKVNRYELLMNGKCIYSGIYLEYQVTMLKPDTEYKFEIVALTSDGKFKSKPSKARTLKDEYEPERLPLYPGPQNLVKEKTEQAPQETKKTKELKDLQQNVKSLALRQKSKTKIIKEVVKTNICEDISVENVKKTGTRKNSTSIFPTVSQTSLSIANSNASNDDQTLTRINAKSSFVKDKAISDASGKSLKSINENRSNSNSPLANASKYSYSRSRTLVNLNSPNNLNNLKKPAPKDLTFVHPTTFTLNVKDMVPKFPLIPFTLGNSTSQSSNPSLSVNPQNYQTTISFNNSQIPMIQLKNVRDSNAHNLSHNMTTSASSIHNKPQLNKPLEVNLNPDLSIQYQYLLNKFNTREKTSLHVSNIDRTNNYSNLNHISKFTK